MTTNTPGGGKPFIQHNDYLLVTVPEGAKNWVHNNTLHSRMDNGQINRNRTPLPPGSWQLIGLGSELREEEKKEICERVIRPGEPIYFKLYNEPYDNDGDQPVATTDVNRAFMSLLRSHNLNASTVVILKLIQP